MARRRDPAFLNWMRGQRRRIKVLLPLPCIRCGRPVFKEQEWDVGHYLDIALHPDSAMRQDLVGPEHRSCNRRSGGRLGASISNRNRTRGSTPNW